MPRSILIPVDGSENSERAFNFYVENLMKAEDTILILHVTTTPHLPTFSIHEPLQMPAAEWTKKIQEQVEKTQKLAAHYEMLCEAKKLKKKTLLESGKPGEAICVAAKKENASMIVMGSRGLNAIRRTFVGSVSDYVLHHTHVPVTVVPPE
ncbi:universal stress protein Slr1101-like [Hydractinia symbiolongicarpus]|uniref:universal stress protein Slr1101-like n=1 Tax=Hydractinia symbiolongicarpus TaxID=13093 RepID=UPI00254E801D|nr:universal stress protein Slr1101-like [Hydractinia symbiolongicarpus]